MPAIIKQSPARWMAAYKPIIFRWASDYFPNVRAGEVGFAVTEVRLPTTGELTTYANLRADDVLVVHGAVTPGLWPMGQTVSIAGTNLYNGVFMVAKEITSTLTVIEAAYVDDDLGLSGTIGKYYNHFKLVARVIRNGSETRDFTLEKDQDDRFTLDVSGYMRDTFEDVFEVAAPGMDSVPGPIVGDAHTIVQGYEVLTFPRFDVPDSDGIPVSTDVIKDELTSEGLFVAVNAVQPYEHYTKDEVIDLRWMDDLESYLIYPPSTTMRFLTYGPRTGQVVRPLEDFFLCFLWNKSPGMAIKVHIETFDAAGGAVAVWNFNHTTPQYAGILPVGPNNLPLIVTSGVKTYTIHLRNVADAVISETFTLTIDNNCSEVARRFFWLNSLGGIDQYTMTGREKPLNSVKRWVSERPNMPVTTEALGTGSYQRRQWKVELLRRFTITSEPISPTILHWLYDSLHYSVGVKITRDGTLWTEVIPETQDHIGPSSHEQYERFRWEYSVGTDNVTHRR